MSIWLALLIGLVPSVLGLAGSVFVSVRTLRESRGRTKAEELDIGIGSANKVMASLTAELERQSARLKDIETELDAAERRAEAAESLVIQETRRADAAEQQRDVLLAYARAAADWMVRYYRAGHPAGMPAPPSLSEILPKSLRKADDASPDV